MTGPIDSARRTLTVVLTVVALQLTVSRASTSFNAEERS